MIAGPTGNQPTTQGAAGRDNGSKRSRGGPNAPARADSEEEAQSEESKARIEFMNALLDLRKELSETKE